MPEPKPATPIGYLPDPTDYRVGDLVKITNPDLWLIIRFKRTAVASGWTFHDAAHIPPVTGLRYMGAKAARRYLAEGEGPAGGRLSGES